jgi:hypothetical protein
MGSFIYFFLGVGDVIFFLGGRIVFGLERVQSGQVRFLSNWIELIYIFIFQILVRYTLFNFELDEFGVF